MDGPRRCSPLAAIACPIDGTPLQDAPPSSFKCVQGHTYDRARAGYVNLLSVQHKASRDPGDSKEMVAARRRFLDTGAYGPIAARTSEIVLGLARARGGSLSVLDAGCGEGSYLDAIARAAEVAGDVDLRLAGIDISKWAVQAAAKRTAACFWAVASNRRLPFLPGGVDLVLSLFGFPLWESFATVQPADGMVLLVDPAPEHLIELRSIIYPAVTRSPPPSLEAAARAGYHLRDEQRVTFPFALETPALIADLLAMTPHDHRATAAGREALARLDRLDLTADVVVRVMARG